MTVETARLIAFSLGFGAIGYIVGGMRVMWQIYKYFPDLYDEMKRRCSDEC